MYPNTDTSGRFAELPGRNRAETQAEITRRIARVVDGLREHGPPDPLSTASICDWHRAIFYPFGADAGRLRREWENVEFWITRPDVDGEFAPERVAGSPSGDLRRELDEAISQFEAATASQLVRRDVLESCRVAGWLAARVIRTHPFVDGNHRVGFVVLTAGLLRLGQPAPPFTDAQDEIRMRLSWSMRKGRTFRSIEPLAEWLSTHIAQHDDGTGS